MYENSGRRNILCKFFIPSVLLRNYEFTMALYYIDKYSTLDFSSSFIYLHAYKVLKL